MSSKKAPFSELLIFCFSLLFFLVIFLFVFCEGVVSYLIVKGDTKVTNLSRLRGGEIWEELGKGETGPKYIV